MVYCFKNIKGIIMYKQNNITKEMEKIETNYVVQYSCCLKHFKRFS